MFPETQSQAIVLLVLAIELLFCSPHLKLLLTTKPKSFSDSIVSKISPCITYSLPGFSLRARWRVLPFSLLNLSD